MSHLKSDTKLDLRVARYAGANGDADLWPGRQAALPKPDNDAARDFSVPANPDFNNYAAFDFVVLEMDACIRAMGGGAARIPREVLIERGVAKNISRLAR